MAGSYSLTLGNASIAVAVRRQAGRTGLTAGLTAPAPNRSWRRE
jgi:hypothetical protein